MNKQAKTSLSIEPLRKRKKSDGTLYARSSTNEKLIAGLSELDDSEIEERCKISDIGNAEYVPCECVMYFLRRRNETDAVFEALFRVLVERMLTQLPTVKNKGRAADKTKHLNTRERVISQFGLAVARDREEYEEKLDFFEIRFKAGIAKLRASAYRKGRSKVNNNMSLEALIESSGLSENEETPQKIGDFSKLNDKDYRIRFFDAINQLPDDERTVIEMVRRGIPFESSDPEALSISKTIKKTPKTARQYRDKAFAKLKELLSEEDE